MNSFIEALKQNKFILTATIDPPAGLDMTPALDLADSVKDKVDGFIISDNRGAKVRMSPMAFAPRLKEKTQTPVLMALSGRDKNRLALSSDIMGAAGLGLDGLLLVSGDAVALGDQKEAKAVHDLDSIMSLKLASKIIDGEALCLGATVAVAAEPIEAQVMKLNKKLSAGAQFVITRPVADPAQFQGLKQAMSQMECTVIAGLELAEGQDTGDVARIAEAVKGLGASGLHLFCEAEPQRLPEMIEALGGLR